MTRAGPVNRQWVLQSRPKGDPSPRNLDLRESQALLPDAGQLLVRNIFLSLDPTHRLWMSEREQYLPAVQIGEVMRGSTLGVVESSRASEFEPGDIVRVRGGGWQLYSTVEADAVRRFDRLPGIALSASMSVLGTTGLTAFVGIEDLAQVREGETLVVSAAAGAVGSIAGQLAKLRGATVVGIAGGPEKCRWLVDELKFDAAIDYRSEDVGTRLDALLPDGIDVDFENVGGVIMDGVFSRMRTCGRMILCGLISAYNREGPIAGPTDFGRILMRRLSIRGFTVTDHFHREQAAHAMLTDYIARGRLHWKDCVIDGLENAPDALGLLFTGQHDGKLMVRVSEEPA